MGVALKVNRSASKASSGGTNATAWIRYVSRNITCTLSSNGTTVFRSPAAEVPSGYNKIYFAATKSTKGAKTHSSKNGYYIKLTVYSVNEAVADIVYLTTAGDLSSITPVNFSSGLRYEIMNWMYDYEYDGTTGSSPSYSICRPEYMSLYVVVSGTKLYLEAVYNKYGASYACGTFTIPSQTFFIGFGN